MTNCNFCYMTFQMLSFLPLASNIKFQVMPLKSEHHYCRSILILSSKDIYDIVIIILYLIVHNYYFLKKVIRISFLICL